jgi:hypothetical protein
MRDRPQHTCFNKCLGCAYELGFQTAKKKSKESAKYVWMVVGSDNPCDIRRYAFSHNQAIDQLSHTKKFKDTLTLGEWTLFKLVRVRRTRNLLTNN